MEATSLKNKALLNINAGDLLLENTLYAPCIHCYYYGCFQELKAILYDFFEFTTEELNAHKHEIHTYSINYIHTELSQKTSLEISRKYKRQIKELKELRKVSDYDAVDISYDKANRAQYLAKGLRTELTRIF
jgi:uncharacterized protein (UPF0332 family)